MNNSVPLTKVSKILGLPKEIIDNWTNAGYLETENVNGEQCISKNQLAALQDESFTAMIKELNECKRDLKNQISKYKKQIVDLKLLYSINAEIKHLNKMSAIVMTKMWRVMAEKIDVSERNAKMIEMALQGCSSSYIANKMNISAPSVQNAIREGLKKMSMIDNQTNLLNKIQDLESRQNQLLEENDILRQNLSVIKQFQPKKKDGHNASDEQQRILETKIADTNLPGRVIHVMDAAKINRVIDMARKNANDLMRLKNMGPKSIQDISLYLERYGLKLGTDYYYDTDSHNILILNT